MTKTKDCIATARAALNLFTSDELEAYIKQVGQRTRELEEEGIPFARSRAMKEINKSTLDDLLSDSAIAANDIEKFSKIEKKMEADIKQRSFLEKTAENTDYNIETAQKADINTLNEKAFGQMTKEHLDILEGNELNDEIYAYADGVETDNAKVREIGSKLRDYTPERNQMLIRSNALHPSEINEDRFFRAGYNQSKISKLGKENFVAKMKQFIDLVKTFKHTKAMDVDGKLDMAIVDDMIGNTFDNIIQGNGVLFTNASVARDLGKIKKSRQMFYVYKDWRSWGQSNATFGDDSLMKAWMSDIHVSGNQSGMAKIMGSSPQDMYNKMREIEVKKRGNSPKESVKHLANDGIFKQLLGANQGTFNPTIASLGIADRAISSMARLGDLVLKSVSDNAQVGGMAQRLTGEFWGPYFNSLRNAFNIMPSAERQYLAKTMAASLNTHMGAVARHVDLGDMGSVFNRLSNKFFYGTASTAWDNANKLSAMEPVMRAFGKNSKRGFNALNTQQQKTLSRFNISEVEWDGLRAQTKDGLFTVDNVNNMSDADLKSLWNKTDKSSSLMDYRDDLYRKVFGMFDTAHEFSTLNPTAYTRMISSGNFQAGTPHGELWRSVMQFKSYPIQYFRRVVTGGMQDMDSNSAKLMYALNMTMGTIMLEALSQTLVAIGQGLSPPDPTKMSNSERSKYFLKLLSGGAGIFNKVMDPKSQDKNLFVSMFNTAALRLAEDPFVAAFALASGNLEGAKKSAKDFVNVANPLGTVPLVSPYVNSFLGHKPYMEAGQRQLFGD
jgi:hypothetical protein